MKRLIFSALVLISIAAPAAFAQGGSALLVPAGARSLSMGGVTLRPDADKLSSNLFYGAWAPKTAGSTLVGGDVFFRASERFALSVEGHTFLDKPYEITTSQGMVKDTFRPTELIMGLGYDVQQAYNLDGGISTQLLFLGRRINNTSRKEEDNRKLVDIVYFASAYKPD